MKLIHCSNLGCVKIIPENVYLSTWKARGFKVIGDVVDSTSSLDSKQVQEDDINLDNINLEEIDFQEIKKIAKQLEINTHKMKKEEIIEAIKAKKEGAK